MAKPKEEQEEEKKELLKQQEYERNNWESGTYFDTSGVSQGFFQQQSRPSVDPK